jgi:hypothetical protein
MIDLEDAHRHSSNHRAEIEASTRCGCFFCLEIFPPDEVSAWGADPDAEDWQTAEGTTALCPRCGSECVIGDASGYAIDPQFLNNMHRAWVQKTMFYKPKPKAK